MPCRMTPRSAPSLGTPPSRLGMSESEGGGTESPREPLPSPPASSSRPMSMARETVWSALGMGESRGAAGITLPWLLKPLLLVLGRGE